jgi:hypothetical protein
LRELKKLAFTVTNDLNYDQRMQRICGTLANAGYDVLLIGRKLKTSPRFQKLITINNDLNAGLVKENYFIANLISGFSFSSFLKRSIVFVLLTSILSFPVIIFLN